jgi:putative CocE/NonD family hydrolase
MLKYCFSWTSVLFWTLSSFANTPKDSLNSEVAAPYYERKMDYSGIKEQTYYVMMDDSVRLAVNVYLPKGLKKGEKIPAVLYQTRYWRAVGFKWPFKWFMKMVPSTENFPPLNFVKYGYALVTVDVRGSGASEGHKMLTMADMREVLDGKNIVDWIVKQDWCSGNVGATGVSYIGNTALYLLYNRHPNVKAIVPTYSLWDLYDDVSAPGGLYFHQFLSQYGNFCEGLDQGKLPESRRKGAAKMATYGVQRVKGFSKRDMAPIWAEHTCNIYQRKEGGTAYFMDDTLTIDRSLYVKDVLTPFLLADRFRQSGAAVYSWSGWWDAAFAHAAVRQFINLNDGRNRLRLGPWNHGGGANVSPTNAGPSQFDDVKEIVRFFDFHLKGIDNGLESSPRVNYYTMGENQWKTADSWPPDAERTDLFLSPEGELNWEMQNSNMTTVYLVDTTHGLGPGCRWNFNTASVGNTYKDESGEDSITVVFKGEVLKEAVEVTGHPQVNIYLKSSTQEGSIFAYLEDVDETGKVWKVTDGQLNFIHRKLHDSPIHYEDCVPYRGYRSVDAALMDTASVEFLSFDMLPTSHLFLPGHRMQVRLAGVDVDNFKMVYTDMGTWEIFHNAQYPSHVELPIMDRRKDVGMKIQH